MSLSKAARSRSSYRPELEGLDERVLPSVTTQYASGLLTITSSHSSDTITLTEKAGKILLNNRTIRGTPTVFNTQSLRIVGNRGNDVITVDLPSFNKAITISGGDGNDKIRGNQSATTIDGGAGNDLIYGRAGNDIIRGGTGNDAIYGGGGNDNIDGQAGTDTIFGEDGDDVIYARDDAFDKTHGGAGKDTITWDSIDQYDQFEIWNPYTTSSNNQPLHIKVMAINYDPRVPSEGNRLLSEVFGWANPREQMALFQEEVFRTSGGFVKYDVVEWIDVDDIPTKADGFDYSVEDYVANWRSNSNWHSNDQADYLKIFADFDVADKVKQGQVDEVAFFGGPYFGYGESAMAGPNAFYVNGPVFSGVPSGRAFAIQGFNYERGFESQLHGLGHRVEATMSRVYGGWQANQLTTNWARYAGNAHQSNGYSGVGSIHYPANGQSDYDYNNTRSVISTAADFLNYPQLTGKRTSVSSATWQRDGRAGQDGYLNWWFAHLPRASGTNQDGLQNNWWKYVFDFNNYGPRGQTLPPQAVLHATDLSQPNQGYHTFSVAYSSTAPIRLSSIDSGDVQVLGPDGMTYTAVLNHIEQSSDSPYVVASYTITAPEGGWLPESYGIYRVNLNTQQVIDGLNRYVTAGNLGQFDITDGRWLDINAMAQQGLVQITHSPSDIGSIQDVFDNNRETLLRSAAVNPMIIQLVFQDTQTLSEFSWLGAAELKRWTIETADTIADLENQSGSYSLALPATDTVGDVVASQRLETPINAKIVRLTCQRLVGDDFVHIREWKLRVLEG